MQPLSQRVIHQKQSADQQAGLSGDELFLIALKTHDPATFKVLYKRYSAALYGNIIRRVRDEEKAKLILEQTFCEAWQSFSQFDQTKFRIFTWINQFALQNIKKSTS
ncbi:hypothetical protein CA265_02170 [Sphingobacteriaceae bacterium GW460-11-11-14-LB5]|nr:hypothetical protein CA265_02170 [Sphingobacteriaceae bacterium GW460-11-11-14-LB5]